MRERVCVCMHKREPRGRCRWLQESRAVSQQIVFQAGPKGWAETCFSQWLARSRASGYNWWGKRVKGERGKPTDC